MNIRPTIDEYYLGVAQAVSDRAECTRRQIGAVIVKDDSSPRHEGVNTP